MTEDTATLSSCVRTTLLALSACSRSSRSLFCSSDSNSSSSSWAGRLRVTRTAGPSRDRPRPTEVGAQTPKAAASEGRACLCETRPQHSQAAPLRTRTRTRTRSVTPLQARHFLLCARTGAPGPTARTREPLQESRPAHRAPPGTTASHWHRLSLNTRLMPPSRVTLHATWSFLAGQTTVEQPRPHSPVGLPQAPTALVLTRDKTTHLIPAQSPAGCGHRGQAEPRL